MTHPSEPKTAPVIEILNLDELGYGPNGSMTRREWRKACLDNFGEGKAQFKDWQEQVIKEHIGSAGVLFSLVVDGEIKFHYKSGRADCLRLDFAGHEFKEELQFNQLEFLLPCDFKYATFSRYAGFRGAVFSKDAWFANVTFNGHASFDKAIFCSESNFANAIFRDVAIFTFVEFTNFAMFIGTKFRWHAKFGNTIFRGYARFDKAEFSGDSFFQSAFFEKSSNFENAVFKKVGHFEEARFVTQPPGFRGVDIATTRLEFSDDSFFPKDSNTEEAVADISFLKRLSDEHGQSDQALNFNAMELRAKRMLHTATWGFKTVTWLYEVVSDFGRSFARPLGLYAVLLSLTFLLALAHAPFHSPKDCNGDKWQLFSELARAEMLCTVDDKQAFESNLHLSGIRAAGEYTLFRAAGVLDFSDTGKQTDAVARRLFGQSIEPWWMRIWGVFKAIASAALLFLAALGLRNQYRIK